MKTTAQCPYHSTGDAPAVKLKPPGAWPPGPQPGITGWGLLRQMSRDLLGAMRRWQASYGGLVHLRIWPEHQIVVTDPALARELLVQHHQALIRWERGIEVFSQLHGHSVLIAEGEPWRVKRLALQPNFAPKPSAALVPAIAARAERALSAWLPGAWPVEQALTTLTMEVIAGMAFSGDITAEAPAAAQALHDVSVAANREFFWPFNLPRWLPSQRAKHRAMAYIDALIARHIHARVQAPRDSWPDDLLSRLLALHADDAAAWPLSAVRDECMTTFLAGHETAAATMTWWMWCMAANPQAQQQARDEVRRHLQGRAPVAADIAALPYVAATLQETMRLYPAAPVLISRRSTAPITLGGWQIPARTIFTVPVQLMQHDARWFPEPQLFRPERFLDDAQHAPRGAYMPFGTGPRICLGQHLVMAEMTVIAAMVLQRFALAPVEGVAPPVPVMNVTLRPQQPLALQLTKLQR
ncbi:cytochrome P450 [Pseudoduganella ginsengisoli]|uniref:Cytochrome P450 n=1 Tax=Pseudoduganella ginsengisoli TaxID=1462440 RepID=A0A6L6Q5F4_9BURK|nr:cytochrome P450 [Pseudoduganella ginsengisoli]MTW04709.1 cytochrome P450 [Pseudoduganella ginsengisoli]